MHAMDKSARIHDLNGWFEVKGNPLSRVGIYDYSGGQIGAPPEDRDRIFKVYRPAEELSAPETIESFKLVPFINDHTMLGENFTATDDRPIDGVIGESVYFEGDTLYGNPKVYSKALADAIKKGKTELSCGYRCRYEFTPGTWNGQQYDVIQRTIRGNHVALVDEGRMGPEVSILDHMTFTVDAKETTPVDEQLAAILEAIKALTARVEAIEAAEKPADPPASDDDDTPPPADPPASDETDEEKAAKAAAAADADDEETPATMDAALKQIAALQGKVAVLSARPAMDEAAVVGALARKSDLVEKLSTFVGTFDHSKMTVQQVAEYGVKKLGINGVAKGHELAALDAALQVKEAPTAKTVLHTAQDAAGTPLGLKIAGYTKGA